ncbi:DUF4197 domain-containing protein [Sphingobacterium faecium]|uniref:DUF4197 domain-containing protein n=2 Tax=Sphingobacterium TaxID=28453 RepID=UPI0024698ADF|nr:DUF4197 domain-containing protein [Sphingobacterium faecium]MDH5825186.1 DUF4197 domain-containing protein [Sphingobacterium faecium]
MKNILTYALVASGLLFATNTQAQSKGLSKLKSILSSTANQNKTTADSVKVTTNNIDPVVTNISKKEATLGIKEALSKGLTNSVNILSVKDGFLGDAAVKILMPSEAQKVEKALRAVGMGSLCDQFISSMNRAAETAVSEAGTVFVNSLSKMTITDAYNILLSGNQNAATTFFKTNTSKELTSKFSPVIDKAMGENNVSGYWNQLTTAYNNLPFSNKVETNLTNYVTQKAIDGLFVKVADQELQIRENIGGSRNTDLLSKVFGWADTQK